jgi:hypothetical protein
MIEDRLIWEEKIIKFVGAWSWEEMPSRNKAGESQPLRRATVPYNSARKKSMTKIEGE